MYFVLQKELYWQVYVIVITQGQGFIAVNRPESEGIARGQGQFALP